MTDPVISVENLGKKYTLSHQQTGARYKTLRDVVSQKFSRLFSGRRSNDGASGETTFEDFWALKDVSFQINPGEVIGIIGRNGAGKSTLLKILSRITEPTQGRIRIKGRIASLLEVGTGFHPELTGRENIFLNGAILGMSKAEIRRKFDEIVAFAEVERFLDTPVKRYSSGMYVRLAFAVAAHLEPEILIVDEVLAVGDAEFQKKCLGKMEQVAHGGRTILFVSHQIAAVTRMCNRGLWMERGRVKEYGQADLICSRYLSNGSVAGGRREWTASGLAPGNDFVRLEYTEILNNGVSRETVSINEPVEICVGYRVLKDGKILIPNIHLFAEDGTLMFILHDWHSGWKSKPKVKGRYRTTFAIPGNFFSEGRVVIKVVISTYRPFEIHLQEPDAIAFTVVEATGVATARGDYAGHIPGVIRPMFDSSTRAMEVPSQTELVQPAASQA